MADRYLKHKPSGIVYIYQSAYAERDDFEEVADLQGTPLTVIEGEATVVVEADAPKTKGRKKAEAPVAPAEEVDLDAALSADAGKGL